MEPITFYTLPKLRYEFGALEPFISRDQLKIHYEKHHRGYVDAANKLLSKLEKARKEDTELDMKALSKDLSFSLGGHVLHSLFWKNLEPRVSNTEKPQGTIKSVLEREFGSIDRFNKEFSKAANSVEGSGWAVLAYEKMTKKPIILQIEKHNVNLIPNLPVLMVLDVWEHAYYLDYENMRANFVDAFWNIVNWGEVNKRLENVLTK
ncbi:MAG: superoxide dismutase [Candidatus Aenigmatarchaeota archaeon]